MFDSFGSQTHSWHSFYNGNQILVSFHKCVAPVGCFAFSFYPVHPKWGKSGDCAALTSCEATVLFRWVIILLQDEPQTNQFVFLYCLPFSHHSESNIQNYFLKFSTVLTCIRECRNSVFELWLCTDRGFASHQQNLGHLQEFFAWTF